MIRRGNILSILCIACLALELCSIAPAQPAEGTPPRANTGFNLALIATPSTSFVSGHERLDAVNNGFDPRRSRDTSQGAYGNWPRRGTQWIQYDWPKPVSVNAISVYWFDDQRGVRVPASARLLFWADGEFHPVPTDKPLGLAPDRYNTLAFDTLETDRLRLELEGSGESSTGILEWIVTDSGNSPNFPPRVEVDGDRTVILPATTQLHGQVRDSGISPGPQTVAWKKLSGPGEVHFENPSAASTGASFSAPGEYVIAFEASDGELNASDSLKVTARPELPGQPLQWVHTLPYSVDSPLWSDRIKVTIVNWIPHCIATIEDPELKEGGLNNIRDAAAKLRGEPNPNGRHRGYDFSNAWVFNTLESMCYALMLDPRGDAEIIAAQKQIRQKLDEWLPIVLSAQEPDGYYQTAFTLTGREHWSPRNRAAHEGYVAGYLLDAAMAHYALTGGSDTTFYDAARRMADCWVANIGPEPGKKAWYNGHQTMEMSLVQFGHLVNRVEGGGQGQPYIDLAKFLLDNRRGGSEYDQSHLPVTEQYEAVGHAVRAVYSYTGMADVAIATGDLGYHSAIASLADNIINKKYYVTGGVGSGETSEGFGGNYSLPLNSYCESCSGCGQLFFMHRMNQISHNASYANLYEQTLYNAILGSLDLEGRNFTYTNPMRQNFARYGWHGCPCCVGNIPRTLLQLPTWMYQKSEDSIYVNLFIGSSVKIGEVAGTSVELIQRTEYPWDGAVEITVNPAQAAQLAIRIRVPQQDVSDIYDSTPAADGLRSLKVNGIDVTQSIEDGYAVIQRDWQPGDRISFLVPMSVQRVHAIDKVRATRNRVALRYGPLIYNVESADQPIDSPLGREASFTHEWRPDLLKGVVAITGQFADGSPLLAIPNYARNNRGGESLVWLNEQP